MDVEAIQGSRYANVLHVDKVSIAGRTTLRIVFKFVSDHAAPSRQALLRPDQAFAGIRVGSVVRIQFCLSRVLRVERVS